MHIASKKWPASMVFLVILLLNLLFVTPAFTYPPQQQLLEKEKALVAELLSLDIQLEKAQQEYADLRVRLHSSRLVTTQIRQELLQGQALLTSYRQNLSRLLSFFYRHGPVTFLAVLLRAKSFEELINRVFLLSVVINRQAELLLKTWKLTNEIRSKLDQLEQLEHDIQKKEKLMLLAINQISSLRTKRNNTLKEVRSQSAQMAEYLNYLESQWKTVIDILKTTMGKLSKFPVDYLLKDNVTITGNQIKAEITAVTFNRILAAAAGDSCKELSVDIRQDIVIVNGIVPSTSFLLTGNFIVSENGTTISFLPKSLLINNTPVEKEVLSYIAGKEGLSWDLTDYFPYLTISKVIPETGKLSIFFVFQG